MMQSGAKANGLIHTSSQLVLALGNDIVGDDAAALVAAEALRRKFDRHFDFTSTIETGLALLDIMSGYDRVLLLDAITTGSHAPGTVLEFGQRDYCRLFGPSPHCMGLPEVLELAARVSIALPREIHILAMEIEMPTSFGEGLSQMIQRAMDEYIRTASRKLNSWIRETMAASARSRCSGPHDVHNEHNTA